MGSKNRKSTLTLGRYWAWKLENCQDSHLFFFCIFCILTSFLFSCRPAVFASTAHVMQRNCHLTVLELVSPPSVKLVQIGLAIKAMKVEVM